MQQFSIKAVERLSGIKAHTLRVWEQRYGIIQPSRKQSNHRFYTNEDLKTILKVVYLYQQGHRISDIAMLSEHALQELVKESGNANGEMARHALLELINAVVDFDEVALEMGITRIARQIGFENAMLQVVFPLLNRLGLLWMTDRLMPGQEHFASNVIVKKIIQAIDQIKTDPIQRSGLVLLLTPVGEFHEIGLLFMNFLLRKNGYNTVYLGPNVPVPVLEAYYTRHNPTHIFVHFTTNLQERQADEYLTEMKTLFPETRIVAGGPVLRKMQVSFEGITPLRSDDAMVAFSRNIFNPDI